MPFSWKSLEVPDGTSHTIAASESVAGIWGGDAHGVRGHTSIKGGINSESWSESGGGALTPERCLYMRNPTNRNQIMHPRDGHWRGLSILYGTGDNRFTTILPPNSPSCFFRIQGGPDFLGGLLTAVKPDLSPPNRSGDDSQAFNPNFRPGIFSASSNHSGGVNCVFLDGNVRFVSETVNAMSPGKTYDDFGTAPHEVLPEGNPGDNASAPRGESLYGVWGALGTPDGGEPKTL